METRSRVKCLKCKKEITQILTPQFTYPKGNLHGVIWKCDNCNEEKDTVIVIPYTK